MTALSSLQRYELMVSALNRALCEDTFKTALDVVLKESLALLGFESGVIRAALFSRKGEIEVEIANGFASLCFSGIYFDGCVCGWENNENHDGVFVSQDITKSHCRDAGFSSIARAFITVEDNQAGIFMAANRADSSPDPSSLQLVSSVMERIGETIGRIRQSEIQAQRAEDLETINTVGRLITSKLTLKEMTCEIVARLGAVLETDEVNVILYNPDKRELSFLASYITDASDMSRPEVYPLSDGMNSWIIRNRKPLLMKSDTLAECKKLGIRHGGKPAKSWLGAPMIYQDNVVGVISVQSYSKTCLYDKRAMELLNIVAGQCAVAVENARLYGDVVEREQEKERLYFSLTHDLLSLVSPISGFVRLLAKLPPDTRAENFGRILKNIVSSSEKITRFVEDILVYSKIKSGKLALNIERSDVLECIRSAIAVYTPEFDMRRLAVTLNGVDVSMGEGQGTGEPLIADFDVAQMERVFLNLIGNAVKYAESRIDVEAMVAGSTVTVRVADDGRGVPAGELEYLFDEYYQTAEKNKGVGLGLPTVKKIVTLHHGEIKAGAVQDGKGFVMKFSWPRTLSDRNLELENQRASI
ncbi:hypothetical protein MNBD_NITROSPINAE01-290 [hydrothermal vent metagenome]|uniref:Histidine kinase domain-containing protein n=1 Tax=hydrothermal vent metagenome TaxID=652676 RepID=A0A3B1C8P6_9ZZZZ